MLLLFLAITLGAGSATAGETIDRDEQLLRQARIDTSPIRLLEFLRQRARADQDPKQLQALIRQLGSDRFAERERASRGLVAAGSRVIPLLQGAASDPDVEVVRRARDCLQQIERNAQADLPLAVIRLLARRQPAGTVETLLAYLPSAGEESVEEEIFYGENRDIQDCLERENRDI